MADMRFAAALLAYLCFSCCALRASARDEYCAGPLVQLLVGPRGEASDKPSSSTSLFYGVLAPFGSQMNESGATDASPLVLAQPMDACSNIQSTAAGSVVLVERGNCSFVQKALNVQHARGIAMLMYNNESGCATMGYDVNDTSVSTIIISSVSVSRHEALAMLELIDSAGPKQVYATLDAVSGRALDPSLVLLWLMAVGTVVVGSLWAGHDHSQQCAQKRAGAEAQASSSISTLQPEDSVDITMGIAVTFVFMASLMLLFMFFFLSSVVFYVLLVFFCLATTQSMTVLFIAATQSLVPTSFSSRTTHVPLVGPCPTLAVLCAPLSAAICMMWVVFRNSSWAWVLQDLQGICLMLFVMRTLKLNSVKVACVLLSLLFAYDVFWVFLEPLIFGGESVMIYVAKGGSSDEFLPMLLRVPRLLYRELGGYSMLGYGDVILPGILVAYTRRLDMDLHLPLSLRSYFLPTCIGYGSGLLLTYCALFFSWFGDQGQPALLYLVPCTLGTVLLIGWMRGEIQLLWHSSNKRYRLVDSNDNDHSSDHGAVSEDDAEAGLRTGTESSHDRH